MKERPIIFTTESVRAILAGQKTMTRRVVKPTQGKPKVAPLEMKPWIIDGYQEEDDQGRPYWAGSHPDYPTGTKWFTCPYGAVGDGLWVKETWAKGVPGCPDGMTHRADHVNPKGDGPASPIKWTPSIFMPRWASRLTLEIVSVRVERLQDITEANAIAEGSQAIPCGRATWSEREAFACLWDSINAKRGYPWESNPWVWAIEFRRAT